MIICFKQLMLQKEMFPLDKLIKIEVSILTFLQKFMLQNLKLMNKN